MSTARAWLLVVAGLQAGCPGLGGSKPPPPSDQDGDGFVADDCAERTAAINPAAIEMCDDATDNDCDDAVDGADDDCKAEPRALTILGSGSVRYAIHYGSAHDLLLEVSINPPPPSGAQLLTDPVRIDQLATPGGRAGAIRVNAVLHARQLIPDGPLRQDLAPSGKWLLFGAGSDYFLAWTRIERSDPVQVAAVVSKASLPDEPTRVRLPVRALRVGQVVDIDLGGGVVRSLQVMSEPFPAFGW